MKSTHRRPPGFCRRRFGEGARMLILAILMVFPYLINAQNITQAEYFYDTDPGYGMGMPISFSPAPNLQNLNFFPDLTSLNTGFHVLYFRVKDENQCWSHPAMRPFLKESVAPSVPMITKAEYFFDNDPGNGNGTQVNINPPADLVNLFFPLDLSGLSPGMHKLYLRTLNDIGNWSFTAVQPVLKENLPPNPGNIIRAEYFLDSDPGYGMAIPIPVIPGPNLPNLVFQPDLTGVASGFHQLFVRVQDAYLHWSILAIRPFYKEQAPATLPNITAMEYFFDSDPGNGNGTMITTTPSGKIPDLIIPLDMNGLTPGFHKFYLRGKDAQQHWGLTAVKPLFKEVVPPDLGSIDKIEYFIDNDPGPGQAVPVSFTSGSNISNLLFFPDLNSVNPGFHRLYLRARSQGTTWSLVAVRSFYKETPALPLPDITGMEYFFDTDPGTGNGYPVDAGSSGSNTTLIFPVDLACVANGLHRLYTRVRDINGHWSITSSDTLTINKLPPQIVIHGPSKCCEGDSIMLTVPNGQGLTWQWFRNGQLLSGATNQVYFAKLSGFYKVHINHSGFCTDSTSAVMITVLPAPAASLAGPVSLCADQPVATYFTQGTGSAYSWTISSGGSLISGGSVTDSSATINWNGTGEHRISVTYTGANGCHALVPAIYSTHIHPNPQPVISGTDTLCISASGTWQTQPGNQAYNWQISPGGSIIHNQGSAINAAWASTGNHWISVNYTDTNGCSPLQPTLFPVLVVPLPIPIVTGPISACITSPAMTYYTESGHENYNWIVTPGGQILSGGTTADHSVTIKWNTAGIQQVSVNYERYGCFASIPGLVQVQIYPPPAPVINGNGTQLGCQGTISTYSTQSGMSGYAWIVSPGGSIVAGGTVNSNTIGIQWNTTGPQWLSVNYSNAQGCSAAQPVVANLTVIPRPVPTISGPVSPGTGTPCQYVTESGMTNYTWTVSPGGVISGGTMSNAITVTWTTTGSRYVKVNYFNAAYCSAMTPSTLQITVIPASLALQNIVVTNQNRCYEASQIITVAGSGTTFQVQAGGAATMVAGQKVVYKTGTKVFPGGYMHGYISQDGLYCQALPVVFAKNEENKQTYPTDMEGSGNHFRLFPNPADDEITISSAGISFERIKMVEISDIHGHEVLKLLHDGDAPLKLTLPGLPPGLYLVRISSETHCEIIKLVIR